MNVLLKKLLASAGLFALLISVAGCGGTRDASNGDKNTRSYKKTRRTIDAQGNETKTVESKQVTKKAARKDKEIVVRY